MTQPHWHVLNIILAIQKEKSDNYDANSNLSTYIVMAAFLCIVVVLSAVAGFVSLSRRKKNKQQHDKNEGPAGNMWFY